MQVNRNPTATSMLPVINIQLSSVCRTTGDSFGAGSRRILGISYAYYLNQLQQLASTSGENLDTILTRYIAFGLFENPSKTPVLIWYAAFSSGFNLSVSSGNPNLRFPWLARLPGYMESGQEPITENARPIFYWDGSLLHRIYFPSANSRTDSYVTDWGGLFGLATSPVEKSAYERIRRHPEDNFDYSAVPRETRQEFAFSDRSFPVLHERFTFV